MTSRTISPQQFLENRNANPSATLIDVRTPVEYREVHAEMAELMPLDRLDPNQLMSSHNGNGAEMYFICKTGSRAAKAVQKMRDAGYENAVSIEGGTEAWAAAGLPVVRGPKAMSLERQVRIAAGSLVLVGMILGWLVHPGFYAISAFVGAGLVMAGITDFCGMGMLIAKMPWNRVGEER